MIKYIISGILLLTLSGCGENNERHENKPEQPKLSNHDDDFSETKKKPEAKDRPDLNSNKANSGNSKPVETQPTFVPPEASYEQRQKESELWKKAFDFASGLKVFVNSRFEQPDYKVGDALEYFVGLRCRSYMMKLQEASLANSPHNLYPLLVKSIEDFKSEACDKTDSVLKVIPGKYIQRIHSESRFFNRQEEELEITIRQDNSISGFRSKRLSSGTEYSIEKYVKNNVIVTRSSDREEGVLARSNSGDKHMSINAIDGSFSYSESILSGSKYREMNYSQGMRSRKSLTIKNIGDGITLKADETVQIEERERFFSSRSEEDKKRTSCYITTESDDKRIMSFGFEGPCFPKLESTLFGL